VDNLGNVEAVKYEVVRLSPIRIIVDDIEAENIGSWVSSTSVPGYYGDGYRYRWAGIGDNKVMWPIDIPTTGYWEVFARWTGGRKDRFQEELRVLRRLPARRLNDFKRQRVKVGPGSAIRLQHNVYSVPSRLKGEWVETRLYAEHVEVWYAQHMIESMPRLRGEEKHRINYRHIIDCLVRKPGAFENYRYRDDLFPSSRFRMAYDVLIKTIAHKANKEYVKILHYAASESETRVDDALRMLFDQSSAVSFDAVKALVDSSQKIPSVTEVSIDDVNLEVYDHLLDMKVVQSW